MQRSKSSLERAAGILVLFAVAQFLACEGLCASAWRSVDGRAGYDYTRNWISDLAAPGLPARFQGAVFVSPLHALMTASLLVLALLGLTVGLAVTSRVAAAGLRRWMRALVAVFATGVGLVAAFPETGHVTVHNTGACLTIAADLLAVLVGCNGRRLGVPRWAARGCLALGLLGSGVGVLFGVDVIDSAVAERVVDYAPLVACVVGALAALLPRRRPAPELVIDLTDAALAADWPRLALVEA